MGRKYSSILDSPRKRQMRRRAIMKRVLLIVVILAIVTGGVCFGITKLSDSNKKDDIKPPVVENSEKTENQKVANDPVETTTEPEEADSEATKEDSQYEKIESDSKLSNYDGVVVIGNSGYELYTYREDSAKAYAKSVNKLAEKLKGKADVYDIVIPLSSGIVFPDNRRDEVNSSDQKVAMDNIFGMLKDGVKKVDIYDALMSHRTEYIYFRTDHHWTTLGAYYAYQRLCEEKGIEAEDIDSYEKKEFDGFLGSFYNDTSSEKLKKKPDVVTGYIPKAEATLKYTTTDGQEITWPIINDVSSYGAGLKYSAFIGADNPYTIIENSDLTDGSSCIVVKESFGNAFVPFLVDHYQTIYVIDYRYYQGTIEKLVKDTGAQDVILANNLSMIRNQYLVGQFQKVVAD